MSLVAQGEPAEQVVDLPMSNEEMEDDFARRLGDAQHEALPDSDRRPISRSVLDKISQPSLLREASVSAASRWTPINTVTAEQEKDMPVIIKPTKRRRTTESRRTKSSRLPLERVPVNHEIHGFVQSLTFSCQRIEQFLERSTLDVIDVKFQDTPRSTFEALALQAIELLRVKLDMCEGEDNEATALAFVGTLARLRRSLDNEFMV